MKSKNVEYLKEDYLKISDLLYAIGHYLRLFKIKISPTRVLGIDISSLVKEELRNAEEELKNFKDRNRRIENSPTLQLEEQRLLREVTVLTGVFTTLKQNLESTVAL